jgi:hypothetical protein
MSSQLLQLSFRQIFGIALALFVALLIASKLFAWTGPTAIPPNGNVPAPVNVGSVNQVKSAGLGLNSLAVFGNTLLGGSIGANAYLNFGATSGEGGYGFRDNGGAMEYKNQGGTWAAFGGGGSGGGGTGSGGTPDWSNPKSYDASVSSNEVVNMGAHKLCVLSMSGDATCGRCIVQHNSNGAWSLDEASCNPGHGEASYMWCAALCFD